MMKDILALWFNPGDSFAHYWTAEREMLILICQPHKYFKTEAIRDRKHVAESTLMTRIFKEGIKLTNTNTPILASNFFELRCNVGTFCGFIWTLFGPRFKYGKEPMHIKAILDQPSMQAMSESYTSDVSWQTVWTIICNGKLFFSKVKLCHDLNPTE
jgi:hypothetical protein